MSDLTVNFSSEDARILDDTVRKVVEQTPENLYGSLLIETLPAYETLGVRVSARKITFEKPEMLLANALAKIDIPHNVHIFVR